jgi:hypothetical protein
MGAIDGLGFGVGLGFRVRFRACQPLHIAHVASLVVRSPYEYVISINLIQQRLPSRVHRARINSYY